MAKGLISELGIDVGRWAKVLERDAYAGLGQGTFFDKETFGQDKLVKGLGRNFWDPEARKGPDPAALAEAPLHRGGEARHPPPRDGGLRSVAGSGLEREEDAPPAA